MRAELANLNHCAVPFLSRANVNLSWYDSNLLNNSRNIIVVSQPFRLVLHYSNITSCNLILLFLFSGC